MEKSAKQELIVRIKEEWNHDINRNTDIEEIKNLSEKYLTILDNLNDIKIEQDKSVSEDNETPKYNTEEIEKQETSSEDIYVLRRRLFGGDGLKDISDNNPIFVPETVIRNEKLNHGDHFLFIKDGVSEGRNYFEKIEKPKDNYIRIEDNDIESYDYATVQYDKLLDTLVCAKSYEEGVLKNIPQYPIVDYDINKFKIEEGDIVSVARRSDTNYRVRWKYNTQDPLPTPESKKSSYYKTKYTKDENAKDNNWLKDKTIGIVGGDTFINNYKEEVEKRGGLVKYTDSDKAQQIETLVYQSDLIVIPIRQTSHAKAEISKECAKTIGKPFVILDTNGRSYFVDKLKEHFNMKEEI
ncbi:DUF2325 domain-containing protein (plasmid) [Staphylococcus warneri]|nr:DUF2325 domain-containing protein [Staphylococcus warneri]